MSSPWKKQQEPEVVVDKVLRRAEMGKIGRKLKARLAFAQYKAVRGWEDLTIDTIEPRVEEELRLRRPASSGDLLSDSSSSTGSEFRYPSARQLMSSPLKGAAIFSDDVGPRSGASNGHRKRTYRNSFDLPSSGSSSGKRLRSSPPVGRSFNSTHSSWRDTRQPTQSSPIKPRKHTHFTTSSGPNLSFYNGSSHMPDDFHSANYAAASDDEENLLPAHSFNVPSSPPSTPPPARNRNNARRQKDKNGKSGEEGADLLLYLATSPSPAVSTARARIQPPSTPPPKNSPLPSSMMTTPGGGSGLLSVFGGPNTPSQAFDFSDFVNITPSPAQKAWRTPRIKTPLTVGRRRLTFEPFSSSTSSPSLREQKSNTSKHTGLGMQLGGDLMR
ncbi:hypothetical protein BJ875DRAFT_488631 [Amylocarpus encephaloides]|uniref:Uncharacterized protein n=1 Tax=Amylocarpus encephaloides TaxID=45428 RepID=A0A9P7YAY5_9HELO|nr:hypothetical protein BJ875DRAFT_488631 [Amylocarpus encephaloides]